MGLDMYINRKVVETTTEEVKYWRKFGELHNLIASMWSEETGNDPLEFNCVEYELTPEICDTIINKLTKWDMPDHNGFFFGGSNKEDKEYINDAIKVFKQVKKDVLNGDIIVYSSWW